MGTKQGWHYIGGWLYNIIKCNETVRILKPALITTQLWNRGTAWNTGFTQQHMPHSISSFILPIIPESLHSTVKGILCSRKPGIYGYCFLLMLEVWVDVNVKIKNVI